MDIRVSNTKNRIVNGLFECMKKTPFRELKNQDIIAHSQVSARTFYRYYRDKNNLLDEIEKELLDGLKEAMLQDRKTFTDLDHAPDKKELLHLAKKTFGNVLQYCMATRNQARVLLSGNGDIRFLMKIQELGEQEFAARLPYLFDIKSQKIISDNYQEVKIGLAGQIYVSDLINVIITWLKYDDQLSLVQIERILSQVQIISPWQLLLLARKRENEQKNK